MSVVAIVVISILGIVLLVVCLGVVGSTLWFLGAGPVVAPPAPVPPSTAIKKAITPEPLETFPVLEGTTDNPPVSENPPGQSTPEESTKTP